MSTYVFNPTSVSVAKPSPQQAPNGATVPQTWVHTAACLHTCLQRPHDFRVLSRLHIIFTLGSLWHVLAPTQLAPGLWPRPNLSHAGLTCHAPPGSWGTKWAYAVSPPSGMGRTPLQAGMLSRVKWLHGTMDKTCWKMCNPHGTTSRINFRSDKRSRKYQLLLQQMSDHFK